MKFFGTITFGVINSFVSLFKWIYTFFSFYTQVTDEKPPVGSEIKFQTYDEETIEWFNTIIHRWWFFALTEIERILRDTLNEQISLVSHDKINNINVTKVDLSNYCPQGTNMRIKESNLRHGAQYMTNRGVEMLVNYLKEVRHHTLVCEVDLDFSGSGFEVEINCGMDGKDVKLQLKNCSVYGKVNLKFSFDTSIPFPYISSVKVMFVDKPRLNRDVIVQNSWKYLKLWLNSKIDYLLEQLPSNCEYLLYQSSTRKKCNHCLYGKEARGVVIVSMCDIKLPDEYDEIEFYNKVNSVCLYSDTQSHELFDTRIIDRKFKFGIIVENLNETITVELISKSNIGTSIHATFPIKLSDYPVGVGETTTDVKLNNFGYEATFELGYIDLEKVEKKNENLVWEEIQAAYGIVHVEIQSALSLKSRTEDISLDSYCTMFVGDYPVHSTEVVRNNPNPRWNMKISLLVRNASKKVLTFAVYNKSYQVSDPYQEVLGVFNYPLKNMDKYSVNLTEILRDFVKTGEKKTTPSKLTLNIQYVPLPTIGYIDNFEHFHKKSRRFTFDFNQTAESSYDKENNKEDIELKIIEGRNLKKADIIGSSDPFFQVFHNKDMIHESQIILNELNPTWQETVILSSESLMPQDKFIIRVLDYDKLKKPDFLGEYIFRTSDIYDFALYQEPKWLILKGVETGQILISVNIKTNRKLSLINSGYAASESSSIKDICMGNGMRLSVGSGDSDKTLKDLEKITLSRMELKHSANKRNLVLKIKVQFKLLKSFILKVSPQKTNNKLLMFNNEEIKIPSQHKKGKCEIELIETNPKSKITVDRYSSKVGHFINRLKIHNGLLELTHGNKLYFNLKLTSQ